MRLLEMKKASGAQAKLDATCMKVCNMVPSPGVYSTTTVARSMFWPIGEGGISNSHETCAPLMTPAATALNTASKLACSQMGKRRPPVAIDAFWYSKPLETAPPPLVHSAFWMGSFGSHGLVGGLVSCRPMMLWKT